jgi:hypothetical protein
VERLRANWVLLLTITIASAIAIMVLEPDYTKLQTAKDAADFQEVLDHPKRAAAAAVADIVFAAGYGLLGVVGFRAHGRGARIATVGAIAIAAGALFDMIENLFVIANVARHESLTDGWIDAMQVPGTLKWAGSAGVLLLFGLMIVRAVQDRSTDRETTS